MPFVAVLEPMPGDSLTHLFMKDRVYSRDNSMPPLSENQHAQIFLPHLRELAAGRECFLVGGAIRDWLLGRSFSDFDFATPFNPAELSRSFANVLGGHWFYLDEKRGQTRVVVDLAGTRLTFDFAPYRAASLASDLALRDYTINAMAFALEDVWTEENLIDLMQGRQDLVNRQLRLTSEAVLRSDPLRILKGLRHCLELGFKPEPGLLPRMSQSVADLRLVAAERVRHEMMRILLAPCETGYCVSLLMETGVGRFLWGDHFDQSDQALVSTQFRMMQFWTILEALSPDLLRRLHEPIEDGVTRQTLLHFFFLLDTISPGCALETARQWRFSRNAISRLTALTGLGKEIWSDFEKVAPGCRALLLWSKVKGIDPVDLLLSMIFSLDATPAAAIERAQPALSQLLSFGDDVHVHDLIDGHALQAICGTQNGRLVGQLLAALRQAEAYGEIENRAQAEAYARRLYNEKD